MTKNIKENDIILINCRESKNQYVIYVINNNNGEVKGKTIKVRIEDPELASSEVLEHFETTVIWRTLSEHKYRFVKRSATEKDWEKIKFMAKTGILT